MSILWKEYSYRISSCKSSSFSSVYLRPSISRRLTSIFLFSSVITWNTRPSYKYLKIISTTSQSLNYKYTFHVQTHKHAHTHKLTTVTDTHYARTHHASWILNNFTVYVAFLFLFICTCYFSFYSIYITYEYMYL